MNVAPSCLLQPDRVTALYEGSDHVIHLHIKGHDWLINTGKLSRWRGITEPYLQSQGVNRLDELILCDTPAHEIELLEQVNSEFQPAKIVPSPQWQAEGPMPHLRAERGNPSVDSDPRADFVEILFSEQPARSQTTTGDPAVEAILVRLDQFRILILPKVAEASLSALKCGHADVVYCGRHLGRRFPRDLIIAKLSPSVLVLNGTKPEVIANSVNDHSSPKCFYLKQDGAVTTALFNRELVVRSYCGSEIRLPSLSR